MEWLVALLLWLVALPVLREILQAFPDLPWLWNTPQERPLLIHLFFRAFLPEIWLLFAELVRRQLWPLFQSTSEPETGEARQ